MKATIHHRLKFTGEAVLNSYSQLFFSDNRWFALLLLVSTFVDPYAGFSGFIALIISISAASWLSLPKDPVHNGVYGYNSLLAGLVLGNYFSWTWEFWLLLILLSVLTLFISVWLASVLYKSGLPLLGLPFLLGIWTLLLSVRQFDSLTLSDRGIYRLNEVYELGGASLLSMYEWIQYPPIPKFWEVYLKSLGAIFFQYNILSGIFIATGILIYSRIAFTLSLLGFSTGYVFYYFVGGGLTELHYSYIGFNFILSAISLGCFFVIPSVRTYLLVILLTPVMALVVSALSYLIQGMQLPVYSLPFNLVILLILYVLKLNLTEKGIQLVKIQAFQPEKNLYRFLNEKIRFRQSTWIQIHPPFFGAWTISQDENGKITHLGDWRYAWDFVVKDETGSTYRKPGTELNQYYGYNLPVLAPAAGTVAEVLDEIPDNPVGGVDLKHNWGNTVVIWHGEGLYSKVSHLKSGTIKVKAGDYVARGDLLGTCGNSGRSPEPHIHFQLQSTPYIGSRTLRYPLTYYLEKNLDTWKFQQYAYPQEGAVITGIQSLKFLREAYDWPAGKVWLWEIKEPSGNKKIIRWEVLTDLYGARYIRCTQSGSTAWFVNDGTCFWFTHFSGNKNNLLFDFYIANFKVLLSYHSGTEIPDVFPVHMIWKGLGRYIQDFMAPFYMFMSADYTFRFSATDDEKHPAELELEGCLTRKIAGNIVNRQKYITSVNKNGIYKLYNENQKMEAICIES